MFHIDDFDELTEWVELGDTPAKLPVGIKFEGNFIPRPDYAVKTFTGKTEIALGDLEDRHKSDNLLAIYKGIIPEILASIHDLNYQDLTRTNKQFFAQMYLTDILAIIVNARIYGQGWGIPLRCRCPCEQNVLISPVEEQDFHDLRTLRINLWLRDEPPIFTYPLQEPVDDRISVNLEPPTFASAYDPGLLGSALTYENKLIILLGDITEIELERLSKRDRVNLTYWAEKINTIGIEQKIDMWCPECNLEWDAPLQYGENHPDFYLRLMSAPRMDAESSVRDLLYKITFFLTTGEQAPLKSASEVENLTPRIREKMVNDLSENYKEQQRKMKSK